MSCWNVIILSPAFIRPVAACRRAVALGPAAVTRLVLVVVGAGVLGFAPSAQAQAQSRDAVAPPNPVLFEIDAGGELEGYLRALQNVGLAAPHPWSVRGFSTGDVQRIAPSDASHPWGGRYDFGQPRTGGLEYGLLSARGTTIFNSAFPWGGNDGPLWAGRGLTGAVQFGGFARFGPVSLVVSPIAFQSQNRAFELAPTGIEGDGIYRTPLSPRNADLPQRFGSESYGRLDAGNSTLRLDLFGVAAGVSTAAQQWGPAGMHPLVLGPNAGGFPHGFIGTEKPVNVWLGDVHGRLVAGRLDQSDYSPAVVQDPRRLMTGLVLAFLPRGLTGLEVGIARFGHLNWPAAGVTSSQLLQPLRWFVGAKPSDREAATIGGSGDNELVSIFARWNVPSARVEVFGEFIKVDGAADFRQLSIEPDDLSGYMLGMRRAWVGPERMSILRGEVYSTVSSHRERGGNRLSLAYRGRPMYQHGSVRQGHTHRGQLLVSPAGHGGAGSTLGFDRYHAGGRWTVEWERRLERDRTVGPGGEILGDADVRYALSGSVLRFTGPVNLEMGVRGIYNFNRNLQDDVFNLNLRLAAAYSF